jgi:hypothetical protein
MCPNGELVEGHKTGHIDDIIVRAIQFAKRDDVILIIILVMIIVVLFVAGYGAPGDVPADLRSAIKLIGASLYMSREAFVVGTIINDLPQVDRILRNYQNGMRV